MKNAAANRFLFRAGVYVSLLLLTAGLPLWGQTQTGSISGTVTDPSGAVIPGVQLTLTDAERGTVRTAVSDDGGRYQFLRLPSSTYDLRAELTGFRTFLAENIRLQVRDEFTVDVTLEIGEITEVVTVSGAASVVNLRQAEVGKVVQNKDIIDLPLNGRNALQLAQLQPGVMPPEPGAVSTSNFSVNGQRGQNNNFLLEGGNNNDLAANFPTTNPNVDALQEFKVQASTYDAEFGRNSGAQINIVLKSGTNEVHGTLFEFHRNDNFDSRDFFSADKEFRVRNTFGFNLGGPVIKDKFFLFGSFEEFRDRSAESITDPLVPSADLRNGIVGDLLNDNGRAVLDPDGDGVIAVNPISRTLLDRFVPLPNGPVDPETGLGQLTSNPGSKTDRTQFNIKANYELTDSNSLAVTYIWTDNDAFDPTAFGNPSNTVAGFGAGTDSRTQNAIINDTHTFGSDKINNFRFAYNRLFLFGVVPENMTPPSELGFEGVNPNNANVASVPNVRVAGAFSVGSSIQGPQGRGDDTFEVYDSFNWIRGDHSMKFGFGWTHFNQDQLFVFANSALFSFNGVLGDPIVDFLSGDALFVQQTGLPDLHFRQNSFEGFFNDNWRLTDRLSVNLGLRVGWFLPTFETDDKVSTVDPIGNRQIGTRQSQVFPNAPPGFLFPGDSGIPRSTTSTDKLNLGPRIGFAYDLTGDGKLALRGGYGIYYNIINTELQLQFLVTQPFGLQQVLGPLIGGSPCPGGALGGQLCDFSKPFGDNNPFPFVSPASEFVLPISATFLGPDLKIPYSHQYSLSLQWEVIRDYLFEIAYVGSTGQNLLNRNQINIQPFRRNPDNSITVGAENSINPNFNSNFNSNLTVQETAFNSHFNSLQLSLNKRFDAGLGFLVSYTYGRSIDNASGLRDDDRQDPFRTDLEFGNSNFDITQRFVTSFQYELPWGPGKWLGGNVSGVAARLIEGWQVGAIISADDGFPVNFGVSGATTTGIGLVDRPDLIGDPYQGVSGDTEENGVDADTFAFNRDAFRRCDDVEAGGVGGPCFGNAGRNVFRGPGDFNVDFILNKKTRIPQLGEAGMLDFRWEVFNLFNNPNFGQPGATLGAANFGRITATKGGFNQRIMQIALKLYF